MQIVAKIPVFLLQFSSVAQSCQTLWDPMDYRTPGLPVHHQLPEFIQTHVHQVGDAIQPSHPLLSPCPPTISLSQHQGFCQWVSYLQQVVKVLEFKFSISPFNEYSGLISWIRMDWMDLLAVKGLSRGFSNITVSKASIPWDSDFFTSNSHIHTRLLEEPQLWRDGTLLAK